nr:MAG TPA: hypothetical protein [Caudoviricetes sp.]
MLQLWKNTQEKQIFQRKSCIIIHRFWIKAQSELVQFSVSQRLKTRRIGLIAKHNLMQ